MSGRAIGLWLVVGMLGSVLAAQAASLTLAWDPSPSSEVTGYLLHYGIADTPDHERCTAVRDVGKVTQYTLDRLAAGHEYVFAVQAYTDDGRTSDLSEPLRNQVAVPEPIPGVLQVVIVDSEETAQENGVGRHVLDGDRATIWHTVWSTPKWVPPHPHCIILDVGVVRTVYGLRYLPRQDGKLNGTVMDYEIYVSLDGVRWGEPWFTGSWAANADEKTLIESHGRQGRYVKLVAKSAPMGRPWTSAAEIRLIADFP